MGGGFLLSKQKGTPFLLGAPVSRKNLIGTKNDLIFNKNPNLVVLK